MWWIDRASHWAQAASWTGMTTGSFIRRSVMMTSFSGNGLQAVDQARPVLDMPQASPRMKGLVPDPPCWVARSGLKMGVGCPLTSLFFDRVEVVA
jgi:hypothetical protein